MARHFSLDSLTLRGRRLFGWGWFLDTDAPLLHAELRVALAGGGEAGVACIEGAARDDVAAAYPGVPHARVSGFMLVAGLPADIDASRPGRFVARLADGGAHEITLDLAPYVAGAGAHGAGLDGRVRRGWRAGAKALLAQLAAWPRRMSARRVGRYRPARSVVVMFDHAMGGGANVFRRARMQGLEASGRPILLVTPDLAAMEYRVALHEGGTEAAAWVFASQGEVLDHLAQFRVEAVEVNNLVTFDAPLEIVDWCADRSGGGARLVFHLHDFHAVCPAFTLIDAEGRYCGVPALDVCRSCLPRNAANSLGFGPGQDTGRWREAWSRLLLAADSVVVFSQASADILARAYPEIAGRLRIDLRPHAPDHGHLRPVRAADDAVLTVGVIGNISRAKGARIVEDIALLAEQRGLPIRVVVIGTLQTGRAAVSTLTVHGPYAGHDLPDLLEQYAVDVCLMPSVCPETYSYVTDEIMAMGLPLAVFDVGAPAERVAHYPRGVVMAEITAEAALTDIMRLAERTAGPGEPPRQERA